MKVKDHFLEFGQLKGFYENDKAKGWSEISERTRREDRTSEGGREEEFELNSPNPRSRSALPPARKSAPLSTQKERNVDPPQDPPLTNRYK